MEKKTIGQFIAALRKASGMTQKDLAERLNVSDKAVSRWERDECAPDLSLIPVIADIFGVTSDELLRGERRPASASEGATTESDGQTLSVKSQKQIQYIMNRTLMQYKIQCLIAAGIAVVGMVIAMTINALNQALVGFFVGLVMVIIAVICLIVFTILSSFKCIAEELESEAVNGFKKSIIYTAYGVCCFMLVGFYCFILPLSGVDVAYVGITWNVLSDQIAGNAIISGVICLVAGFILHGILIKCGIQEVGRAVIANRRLIVKTLAILAAVMLLTFGAEMAFIDLADSEMLFVSGTTFDNYDTFKEYMETPVEYNGHLIDNENVTVSIEEDYVSFSDTSDDYYNKHEIRYYDTQEIRNSDGKLLLRYVDRNEAVSSIHYSSSDDYLPITVYTRDDVRKQSDIMEDVAVVLISVFFVEIIAAVLIYMKKREK